MFQLGLGRRLILYDSVNGALPVVCTTLDSYSSHLSRPPKVLRRAMTRRLQMLRQAQWNIIGLRIHGHDLISRSAQCLPSNVSALAASVPSLWHLMHAWPKSRPRTKGQDNSHSAPSACGGRSTRKILANFAMPLYRHYPIARSYTAGGSCLYVGSLSSLARPDAPCPLPH